MCLLLPSSVPTRHPGQVRGPPFLPFWGRLGGFLSPSGLDTGRGEAAHARALHVHRPVSRRSGVTASERGLERRRQAHRSWAKVFIVAFLHLAFLHQRIIYILLSVASSPLGLACLVHCRGRLPGWQAVHRRITLSSPSAVARVLVVRAAACGCRHMWRAHGSLPGWWLCFDSLCGSSTRPARTLRPSSVLPRVRAAARL